MVQAEWLVTIHKHSIDKYLKFDQREENSYDVHIWLIVGETELVISQMYVK